MRSKNWAKVSVSLLALGLFIAPASADDPARPNWERLYLGGSFGANLAKGIDTSSADWQRVEQGASPSLQMGMNFDTGSLIWGIEGDVGLGGLDWWVINDNSFSLDIVSSLRARVGLPVDNHLIYATVGASMLFGNWNDSSKSQRNAGDSFRPVLGLGFESMITPSMSVRAEGLAHIGNDILANGSSGGGRLKTLGQLRLGVNFHFGQGENAEINYQPDRPNWDRFYIGGYFGGNAAFARDIASSEFARVEQGVVSGLQAGVNFDAGPFVWGIEGDIGNGGLSWMGTTGANEASVELVSTIRGRIGVPVDNHLLYATAGAGLLTIGTTHSTRGAARYASDSKTVVRPVLGLGIESMITPSIALKAEGLVHIGNDNFAFDGTGSGGKIKSLGQLKLGLNMYLGGAGGSSLVTGFAAGERFGKSGNGERPNWSRFYAGGHFGANAAFAVDNSGDQFRLTEHGFASGLQLGANVDQGSFVWGFEGDVGLGGLVWWGTTSRSASVDVISTIRGRIGLPVDNHLVYATAGVGVLFTSGNTAGLANREHNEIVRPVVGLGIESMITPSLSVKAEGLVLIGEDDIADYSTGGGGARMSSLGQLRLGMNYHFGAGNGAELMVQPEKADWNRFYVGGYFGGNIGYGRDHDGGMWARAEQGLAGGLQTGVNFQHDALVWGIEADVGNGGLGWFGGNGGQEAAVDLVSSIRSRIGLSVDNHLVYVTAGAGLLFVSLHSRRGGGSNSEALVRPVVGIGFESMITPSMSLKAEGLAHLGSSNMSFDGSSSGMNLKDVGQMKLGLNFHL